MPEPSKRPRLPKTRVSFVVTTRDETPSVLQSTIDCLLDTSTGYRRELIVVDDGSLKPVEFSRAEIVLVRKATALGVDPSRRLGAERASGDILVWVDAHMRFAPDWLERMCEHVESGALLCAAWWDYDLSRPLCWGAEFLWCSERNHELARSPGLTFQHLTRYPGDGAHEVPMVIGACYMMLRPHYERLGGFSPFFRVWGKSEQDISARAWLTGVGVKCVADAHVGHLSRSAFPYPVHWNDLEFNQVIMARTVFSAPVAQALEALMQPLPLEVQVWLTQVDYRQWRYSLQSNRKMSDDEFFQRFVPNAPENLMQAARQSAEAEPEAPRSRQHFGR